MKNSLEKFLSKSLSREDLKVIKGGDTFWQMFSCQVYVNGAVVGFTSTLAQAAAYCNQWASSHTGSCSIGGAGAGGLCK